VLPRICRGLSEWCEVFVALELQTRDWVRNLGLVRSRAEWPDYQHPIVDLYGEMHQQRRATIPHLAPRRRLGSKLRAQQKVGAQSITGSKCTGRRQNRQGVSKSNVSIPPQAWWSSLRAPTPAGGKSCGRSPRACWGGGGPRSQHTRWRPC
jgi:hypothetical protein